MNIAKKDVLDYTEEELKSFDKEMLKKLYNEAEVKQSLYNTQQMTEKILINSLYGALGNKYFPLFNESMAQAITGNGRYFIRKLANYVDDVLQNMLKADKPYILYSDTDSIYFQIEPFMTMYQSKHPGMSIDHYVDWADNFEKKIIQPIIQKCIKDFSIEYNAYNEDIIGVEREIIADRAVLVEKKKYYARVRDSEGTRYPENDPYLKIMGLELIKSTTPDWSKKYLKDAIPIILDKNESDVKDWVYSIKQEFLKVPLIDIATGGASSRIDFDLSEKGVPFGARAAIVHNNYIESHGLSNSIEPVRAGEKGKRLYLIEPNKFDSNIIAFTNERFSQEIDCVDYDTQFLKGFLKPLELMTNCLNYNLSKETADLDDW